jgi:hypothetical protein
VSRWRKWPAERRLLVGASVASLCILLSAPPLLIQDAYFDAMRSNAVFKVASIVFWVLAPWIIGVAVFLGAHGLVEITQARAEVKVADAPSARPLARLYIDIAVKGAAYLIVSIGGVVIAVATFDYRLLEFVAGALTLFAGAPLAWLLQRPPETVDQARRRRAGNDRYQGEVPADAEFETLGTTVRHGGLWLLSMIPVVALLVVLFKGPGAGGALGGGLGLILIAMLARRWERHNDAALYLERGRFRRLEGPRYYSRDLVAASPRSQSAP